MQKAENRVNYICIRWPWGENLLTCLPLILFLIIWAEELPTVSPGTALAAPNLEPKTSPGKVMVVV